MWEVTIALALFVAGLFYVLMTWNFNHWRKRGVPGPKPTIIAGNYPNLMSGKQHMIHDLDNIYNQYKNKYDAVGIYNTRNPQLLVLSTELAKRMFVSDFKYFHDNDVSAIVNEKDDYMFANNPFSLAGDLWKERRAEVTPGLSQSRIKAVYPVTNNLCRKLSQWLNKQMKLARPEGIDAKDMCLRFTSEMVTDCVLGLKADSFSDNPSPIMGRIKAAFEQPQIFLINFLLITTFPVLRYILKLRFLSAETEKFFIDLMQQAIDTRHAQMAGDKKFERNDFLDHIVQLAKKKNLSTRQMTAHTMTFILDGFETTAGVLSHLLMLLARDEEVQQRLRDELNQHLNKDGLIDFDQLTELPYLEACVMESIRLFPPGFMTNKLCTQTIELPNKTGNNITVERGTPIVVPHYCYMMDEENFPNPTAYKPERFLQLEDIKSYKDRGIFMPFGDGPRICLGMKFAVMQIKAVVVELITKYNIGVNPKTRSDNQYEPSEFTVSLQGGIWLDFEARQ